MRKITIDKLASADLFFGNVEVFPESWATRKHFTQYKENPRPCCALFLVRTDIQVSFFQRSGETVIAHGGAVVFIPAGVCYHVTVEGGTPNHIDTYTVNFKMYDAIGDTVTLADSITLLTNRSEGVIDLHFQKLSEAVHRSAALKLRAELYGLLDALATTACGSPHTYYSIRAGAEALRLEWNRNEKIDKYAALCGVSATYFYRCFRQWSGKSPVEYRNNLRLSNAESMLRHTDMQIQEIAEVIGFEDPFYFCRIFAKRFGASPQKYRQTWAKSSDPPPT